MEAPQKLLERVEAALKTHNINATSFGVRALKDSGFVFGLRRGREPRYSTWLRVDQFLNKLNSTESGTNQ